jgi:hypothetical protein
LHDYATNVIPAAFSSLCANSRAARFSGARCSLARGEFIGEVNQSIAYKAKIRNLARATSQLKQ